MSQDCFGLTLRSTIYHVPNLTVARLTRTHCRSTPATLQDAEMTDDEPNLFCLTQLDAASEQDTGRGPAMAPIIFGLKEPWKHVAILLCPVQFVSAWILSIYGQAATSYEDLQAGHPVLKSLSHINSVPELLHFKIRTKDKVWALP